jgi:hypothetical protein
MWRQVAKPTYKGRKARADSPLLKGKKVESIRMVIEEQRNNKDQVSRCVLKTDQYLNTRLSCLGMLLYLKAIQSSRRESNLAGQSSGASRVPRPGEPTTPHCEALPFGMRMERRVVAPTNTSPGYRLLSGLATGTNEV